MLPSSSTEFRPADLADLPLIVGADMGADPDGVARVVVAATTADGHSATEVPRLWTCRADGELALLSDAEGTGPSVSPDGMSVAFLKVIDGALQVAVFDMKEATTTVLTSFARGVGGQAPRWSPDGKTIAFIGCDAPPRDQTAPYRVTRPIWRRDGMGLIEDVTTEAWVVPAAGGAPVRLTDHQGVVSHLAWSPTGDRLLYNSFAEPGSQDFFVRIVDIADGSQHTVLQEACLAYPPAAAWLPDGRVLRTTVWDIYRALDLVVHDPAVGTDTPLGVEFTGQLFGLLQIGIDAAVAFEPRIVIDAATADAYVPVQNGGRIEIVRVNTTDGSTEVFDTGDYATNPLAIKDGKLLGARTSFARPTYLVSLPLDGGQASELAALDAPQRRCDFTVHHLDFTAEDGQPVEGWFLEPTTGQAPYPTVLSIHGGPFAGWGHVFSADDQAATSAGYGVLLINHRMSSGYGEEFAVPQLGDWGDKDASDLLTGLDHVIELGLADGERVGSFGISGGGYLTSWLLTHNDRFKAGIAEAPVTDWTGMIGGDLPHVMEKWMAAPPGGGTEAMAEYTRMSPLTFAASCTTPMLIIVHESDLRCPPGQGDALYNALQVAGSPVEMLRVPGWSHTDVYGSRDLRGRIHRLEALIDWLDTHVRG